MNVLSQYLGQSLLQMDGVRRRSGQEGVPLVLLGDGRFAPKVRNFCIAKRFSDCIERDEIKAGGEMNSVDYPNETIAYSGIDNLEVMREAKNYNAFLISQVSNASREAKLALDFGAGLGAFAIPLRATGRTVDTVETDPDLKSELSGHGFTVYANTSDLPSEKYDFIYSLNVLEHIQEDRAVIEEFHRLLAPAGRVYIYLPAFNLLWSSMDEKVKHFRRYDRRDLEEKVKSAGFHIEKCRYVDFMGFLATIAFKIVGNKSGDLNRNSVQIFDRLIFPLNAIFDPVFGRLMGKNIFVVARK